VENSGRVELAGTVMEIKPASTREREDSSARADFCLDLTVLNILLSFGYVSVLVSWSLVARWFIGQCFHSQGIKALGPTYPWIH
jgi:hypothetical protein